MDDDVTETFEARVWSLADWTLPGVAAAIGAVFDREASTAPDRWGREEPARRRLEGSVAGFLTEWAPRFATKDNHLLFEGARASVALEACPACAGAKVAPFLVDRCSNSVEWLVDERSVRTDVAAAEEVAGQFVALCEATGASYGRMGSSAFLHQWVHLVGVNGAAGLIEIPRWTDPRHPFGRESYYVEDVHWLNYFGPAFVARWGQEGIEQTGVRRTWTDDGGVVIWASIEPPVVEGVDRLDGYGWKTSFYEHLDPDAFVHEGFRVGGPGERVPSFDEHRAHLRAAPRT